MVDDAAVVRVFVIDTNRPMESGVLDPLMVERSL